MNYSILLYKIGNSVMNFRKKKIGILGGGQLGRMMYEAILKWDLDIHFMDKDKSFPVGKVCPHFTEGDFTDYDDVLNFGKDKDIISIEIEGVNLDALRQLEKQGKKVHPNPSSLKIIKDKGLQKMFYESYKFPTSPFSLFKTEDDIKKAIKTGKLAFPFVQKVRSGGYDGRGVAVIKNENDLHKLLEGPSIVEGMVDIKKEIAVIVARNEAGEIAYYDPVEMVFDDKANLVDYLFAPANITDIHRDKAMQLSVDIITKLDICGLLAVELFVTNEDEVLINEVAPRTHNSGHHTIEASVTSQFEQHIRGIMNMPLGNTALIHPAVMVNIVGAPDSSGPVNYEGFSEVLGQDNIHIHLYGKEETKPFRKMGHVTIIDQNLEKAIEKVTFVKQTLIATT